MKSWMWPHASEPCALALYGYSPRNRGGGYCDAASRLVGKPMGGRDVGHELYKSNGARSKENSCNHVQSHRHTEQ